MNIPVLAARVAAVSFTVMIGAWLAGCSSGGATSGGAPAATAPAGGALSSCSSYPGAKSCHFITVTAAGAQTFHGTDTVPNQQACSSVLAQNSSSHSNEVQLSAPVFLTGPAAAFNVFLDSYHGPGTYSSASNDVSIVFLIGPTQYSSPGPGGSISAVASTDGSVSVSFTKLASGSDASKTISGHAQFTCRNA